MARDKAVLGWVLYDFANVIFALGVVALHLPLWIVDEQGGRDRHVAIVASLSMLVVMLLSPRLGRRVDRTGKRVAPLAISTVICVVLTTMIGTGGLVQSMVIFGLANVAFGCGLVFYDALLPVVSTAENRGQISGRGMAAGFGGALIAVVTGIVILAISPAAKPLVFVALAALFLLGSIPCFLWVKDPPQAAVTHPDGAGLRASIGRCREVPGMSRFLIGRVLYT
ncbi:MAG TPA: MFS transporter, partial [Thermomicrobiales bacterium]|nr:MFS transporter [Thermomicrobiales bacterium]